MSLGNSASKAHATTPGTDFNISSTGCNSDATAKCNVSVGGTFTVAVNLTAQSQMWAGYDADIQNTGAVSVVSGSLTQQGGSNWPACAFPTGEIAFTPGDSPFACADQTGADQSYTGQLATLNFTCSQTPGTGTLTLKNAAGSTDLFGSAGTAFDKGGDDVLTINCNAATNTPTPQPTATPPPQPRVAKACIASKDAVTGHTGAGSICNHFLVREGAKIQPSRCQDANNVVNLSEGLNIPITSVDPKGETPFQRLGAFQFEVRFDAKLVCVSIAAAGPFAGNPSVICSTLDDGNKGLVRFGCVTIGKASNPNDVCNTQPCQLATVSVRPTEETVNQLRPNQDNGIPVQIMNQGCQLSDIQGHEIPIFSCEDADITFRFLEGDVAGPDCLVNVADAQQIAFRWGAAKGSLLFNSFMDLSPSGQIKGDGRIDIQDLQFVFGRLGSTCNAAYPPQLPVNPKA